MNEQPRVFLARSGINGEDEEYALENGMAIIGFREYPSLEGLLDWDAVYKLVRSAKPELKLRAAGNYAGQLWAFALAIKEGDIVVLPRKTTSQIALGVATGPYRYLKLGGEMRHTRAVNWIRPDVPRNAFGQDLLYSFGAYMTVCSISRNEAGRRVGAVLVGKPDPVMQTSAGNSKNKITDPEVNEVGAALDLLQLAHDEIVKRIQMHFPGHALARLVDAVLRADGWITKLSPPGADGGVDILAGRGPLGLDAPRLCIQVKSQSSAADVNVYRTLQSAMTTFSADQGLLICWGGFNRALRAEARQSHFSVRLWEDRDLVEAIYRNYERLPAEIQTELPLKKVWMLVVDEPEP